MISELTASIPSLQIIIILGAVAFIAGVMRGFSGFGGGLLIAPIYSLMLSPSDVVVIILILNLLTTFQLLPEIKPNVHWPTVFSLLIPAFIGIPIGVYFLHTINPAIMRKTISVIVISMATIMLLGWSYKGRHGRIQDSIVGLLSGFLTSIGGVGGPPVILYLLSDKRMTGTAFRAIVLMLFFLMQIITIIQIGVSGAVRMQQFTFIIFLLPIYIFAHWSGAKCFKKWGQHKDSFHRIALWFLLFIGIIAFIV